MLTNGDLQVAFSEPFILRNIVNSCLTTQSLAQAQRVDIDEPTKEKIAKDVSHYSKFILNDLHRAAANKEISCICTIRLLDKEQYHYREDVIRAIFSSLFNVDIEESETSKSARQGSSPRLWDYHLDATLKLSWKSEGCGVICNLLGEKKLRSALVMSKRDTQLNQFRINAKMCDCTFQVGGELFHVHRATLASRSPYFAEFFENRHLQHDEVICFGDSNLSPEVFRAFLDYVYTQQTNMSTSDVLGLLQLMGLAESTGVSTLFLLCQKHLMKQLDLDNFYSIFRSVLILSDDEPLCKDCRRFAKRHAKEISDMQIFHFPPPALFECIDIGRRLGSPELERVAVDAIPAILDHTNFTFFCRMAKNKELTDVKELCKAFINSNSWILGKIENKEERVAYIALMADVPIAWDCFVL